MITDGMNKMRPARLTMTSKTTLLLFLFLFSKVSKMERHQKSQSVEFFKNGSDFSLRYPLKESSSLSYVDNCLGSALSITHGYLA